MTAVDNHSPIFQSDTLSLSEAKEISVASPMRIVVKDKHNIERNPWSLFSISHRECDSTWFGKNPQPVLYALCCITGLNLGVKFERDERGDFFRVDNHNVFMLAFSIFTLQKPKKPKNQYSIYKAMKRWVNMMDHRRKDRQWRFRIRRDERERWDAVMQQFYAFMSTRPSILWTWQCDNSKEIIHIDCLDFSVLLKSVVWASTL